MKSVQLQGDEAAIFAGDLMRMYSKYAEANGFKTEIVEASESDHGGYKEVSFSVSGTGAYSKLKFENGAHRVQRVPETESGGEFTLLPQLLLYYLKLKMSKLRYVMKI